MKSTKFMVGTIVLTLGLLGTGYAYWSDGFAVSTTVSTGTLQVDVTPGAATYTYTTGDLKDVNVQSYLLSDEQASELNVATPNIATTLDEKHRPGGGQPGGGQPGGGQPGGGKPDEDKDNGDGNMLPDLGEGGATPIVMDMSSVSFNIPKMQPGTEFTYTFSVEDKSTIPVVCTVTAPETKDANVVTGLVLKVEKDGAVIYSEGDSAVAIQTQLTDAFTTMFEDKELHMANKAISGDYKLTITMDKDEDLNQGQELNDYVIQMDWKQINE